MKYGINPELLEIYDVQCNEMMFYQYLPIKMPNGEIIYEERLNFLSDLIHIVACDYLRQFGPVELNASYIYLTAKNLYQTTGCSFNRPGYHSDGFMTDDINYIWSNKGGTIINNSSFNISKDDIVSLSEMQEQADPNKDWQLEDGVLVRLNQYVIHRVADVTEPGMRTFVKISFSKDKYDLKGNSHNYLKQYNWEMRDRDNNRNPPQQIPKKRSKKAIPIVREDPEWFQNTHVYENCVFCNTPTPFWHLPTNNPVCAICSIFHDITELKMMKK